MGGWVQVVWVGEGKIAVEWVTARGRDVWVEGEIKWT